MQGALGYVGSSLVPYTFGTVMVFFHLIEMGQRNSYDDNGIPHLEIFVDLNLKSQINLQNYAVAR